MLIIREPIISFHVAIHELYPIWHTIFSDYAILNNSQNTYIDFYVSNWADMDIGCYNNDYVGSDPTRGLYYIA